MRDLQNLIRVWAVQNLTVNVLFWRTYKDVFIQQISLIDRKIPYILHKGQHWTPLKKPKWLRDCCTKGQNEYLEHARNKVLDLITNPGERESSAGLLKFKCRFLTAERVQRAKPTQWIFPANGILKVYISGSFRIWLTTLFDETPCNSSAQVYWYVYRTPKYILAPEWD